jgi:hypothetical protein
MALMEIISPIIRKAMFWNMEYDEILREWIAVTI